MPHQITETSRNRNLVYEVEKSFLRWMRQIETIITQGQQIQRNPPDVGPINELEYWQSVLTRYTSIVEFVSSKPFLNHLECLVQSKSKIVRQWKSNESELARVLNVAKDNVRFVGSLESYWDPLYRCTPSQIESHLSSLILALRNVYKTSRFYNTSDCVASFLVKTTNQLTITCRNYLTENDTVGIFDQDSNVFIEKIRVWLISNICIRSFF